MRDLDKLFHVCAPATGKARSPAVERRVGGTTSVDVDEERSPNSTDENNDSISNLIPEICDQHVGNNLIIDDFNYHIDWTTHNLSTNDSISQKFYEAFQKNFLTQHVHNPTRCRGSNEPSILDLVLTDGDFLNSIDYLSSLGKSVDNM